MARAHGIVKTSIWTDPDFRVLTTGAQRAYLLLISQPQINNCGVLPYVPRRWVKMAADCTLDTLEDALLELEQASFIVVDDDTEELLVRTFIRHDRIERQPNLVKAAQREFAETESRLIQHVLFKLNEPLFKPLPEPLTEGLSKPLPEPLSARTRVRSRGGTRTPPSPSPKGTTVVETPLGEEVSADTPGARTDTPTTAQQAAPPAPKTRVKKDQPTNLTQNGAVTDAVLDNYRHAFVWLQTDDNHERPDWRDVVETEYGVTDDVELAALEQERDRLATQEDA